MLNIVRFDTVGSVYPSNATLNPEISDAKSQSIFSILSTIGASFPFNVYNDDATHFLSVLPDIVVNEPCKEHLISLPGVSSSATLLVPDL